MSYTISKVETDFPKLNSFLKKVIESPKQHFLWLNTLSLLEHIGSRKILLTQSNQNTSEMILRHATEEARHALFFKKAANSFREDQEATYKNNELLRGSSAKIYFAKLDASVRKELKKSNIAPEHHSFLSYLYTTTLIELRALDVYESYNQILRNTLASFQLDNLILEEEGHLDEMQKEIMSLDSEYMTRLERLIQKENTLFSKLLNQFILAVV